MRSWQSYELSCFDSQELVEVVGRSSGVVLMAPPHESQEAAASVSTLLSTLKPKQKVNHVLQTEATPADCLYTSFLKECWSLSL